MAFANLNKDVYALAMNLMGVDGVLWELRDDPAGNRNGLGDDAEGRSCTAGAKFLATR